MCPSEGSLRFENVKLHVCPSESLLNSSHVKLHVWPFAKSKYQTPSLSFWELLVVRKYQAPCFEPLKAIWKSNILNFKFASSRDLWSSNIANSMSAPRKGPCLSTNIIYMFLHKVRRGQLKSFGFYEPRCPQSIIFPHRLVGFETDTSKKASEEVCLEVSVKKVSSLWGKMIFSAQAWP